MMHLPFGRLNKFIKKSKRLKLYLCLSKNACQSFSFEIFVVHWNGYAQFLLCVVEMKMASNLAKLYESVTLEKLNGFS